MTWYVYTFLICKSGSSIHLDFFFIGGTYYLWPPSATFWRHWGYVFSGVDVARSANVWMGKIHGWRWHTCFDLTAAPTRRWTKTISIISIIIPGHPKTLLNKGSIWKPLLTKGLTQNPRWGGTCLIPDFWGKIHASHITNSHTPPYNSCPGTFN